MNDNNSNNTNTCVVKKKRRLVATHLKYKSIKKDFLFLSYLKIQNMGPQA